MRLLPDVTVSQGTVYVAQYFHVFPSLGAGSISIYAQRKPHTNSDANELVVLPGHRRVKVDRSGDVFVNNNRKFFAHGQVLEFKAGSSTGRVLQNIAVKSPVALQSTGPSRLLVVDQGAKAVTATRRRIREVPRRPIRSPTAAHRST